MAKMKMILMVAAAVAVAVGSLLEVAAGSCSRECDLTFASFYITRGLNLTYIQTKLFNQITSIAALQEVNNIPNENYIVAGNRLNIPFPCHCLDNTYLGHVFHYDLKSGDTYEKIAGYYSNLTTYSWLKRVNSYDEYNIPDTGTVNVSINCSCGNPQISNEYGLFLTYPLLNTSTTDSLTNLAKAFNISTSLLESYNKEVNFAQPQDIAFIPVKDLNGSYRPLDTSAGGIGVGAITGISVGTVAALVFVVIGLLYFYLYNAKAKKSSLLQSTYKDDFTNRKGAMNAMETVALTESLPQGPPEITVVKSVEFSYQELAQSTSNFSIANKIGEGGFGAVYYGELRGQKAAIKKMDMQATMEFLAELKVLTHVHHMNLVHLIGYCTEKALFLVYEFIENGSLSRHLHRSAMEPLSWPARVQILLDSARGLEYIHEHTVPVYIHRDIKSANILIDKNFRGKVADFGLAKLTKVSGPSSMLPTRLVGTFGYMPPEYARFGHMSPKVDVYAFGVVIYEIISAKEAIVKIDDVSAETKGLVTLFDNILKDSNGRELLPNLIDPRLGNNYPIESIWKMAHLARACTQENPELRPSMRTVVVALTTLSSETEDWDVGSVYENQALGNLMLGR